MTNYSLTVKNNSPNSGSICVYTTSPDTQKIQQNLRSLAWFTKATNPNSKVRFSWELQYSFAWAETGLLIPGVHFEAGEIANADPADDQKNKVYFDKREDAYLFGDREKATTPSDGALGITTSKIIPHGIASIGVGINGKAALAVDATPNYQFTFIPKIRYWLAFGHFKAGVVLDLNSMVRNVCEIEFPPGIYSLYVELQADNTWGLVKPA
ncbi:MAG: hypothetical protein LBG08_02300 [Spirochaetaceae bacterium]|jgi:hypothetical protein|nr:hypothetical protein [Spirochaetaceae bacterium]